MVISSLSTSFTYRATHPCRPLTSNQYFLPPFERGSQLGNFLSFCSRVLTVPVVEYGHSCCESSLSRVQSQAAVISAIEHLGEITSAVFFPQATMPVVHVNGTSRAVMAGLDIRTVQELMGHSTMTMRYAHLSPAHLRAAVNKASLRVIAAKTQIGTESNAMGKFTDGEQPLTEPVGIYLRKVGGAERVRTAVSRFCSESDASATERDQERSSEQPDEAIQGLA